MKEELFYFVDVWLTDKATDTPEELLRHPFEKNAPLHGSYVNMCPTFKRLEQIAVECCGGWIDWEANRCTFSFDSENGCDTFIDIATHEFGDKIEIEKDICYSDEE